MSYGAILNQSFPSAMLPQLIVSTLVPMSSVTATVNDVVYQGTLTNDKWYIDVEGLGACVINGTKADGSGTEQTSLNINYVGQYEVMLGSLDPVLNNNSWEMIRAAADNNIGQNYWAVGDRKAITINGTVGTVAINGTYYVYILGFNHNSEVEGTGITFGGFNTALSEGIEICFIDNYYNDSSKNGTKFFNINHSGLSNLGGWKGCNLRYDVLGSTNVNNGDATSATATTPISNTLMAAFPSDLRAVMKPMNIYTDNTGGGSNIASYVTKTVDYLPFLAEYEIFGNISFANSGEQNYQTQYQYYKNGNSKVKYRHSLTNYGAYWWTRSPSVRNGNYDFCRVLDNGSRDSFNVDRSIGIAPIFRV